MAFTSAMKNRMMIALVILLIAVVLGLFFYKVKPGYENFAGNSNNGTLTYYYSPQCGYCQEFSPVWDADASDPSGLQYALNQAGLNVKLNKVDITNPNNAQDVNSKDIKGVPTLIYTTSAGKDKEYQDTRTPANIATFIKNNSS